MLPEVTDYCRLFLLRHPELDASNANVAVGAGHADLSRRGKERVLQWMDMLQDVAIDAVWSSDQSQASAPAAGIARAKNLEHTQEERLRDQNMGDWQGRPWDDVVSEDQNAVKDFFERFADRAPPGGESLGQAVERALAWWREIAPAALGKTLAVVTTGSVISGFGAAMLGMRLSRCLSLSLPHGGIAVLDMFDNGARVSAWNVDALRQ